MRRYDRLDRRAVGLTIGLCLLWGVQQVGTKVAAAHGIPPIAQAGLRAAIGTVLLVAWVAARQGTIRGLFRWDASIVPGLALGAVFTIEFALLFEGVVRITASRAILLLYTTPFFTAAAAHWLIPGQRLRPVQWVGLLLAFAGVALATGGAGRPGVGDLLVLLSAVCWAATTIMVRRVPALQVVAPSRLLFYELGVSAVLLCAASALFDDLAGLRTAGPLAWLCVGYQGAVVSFASYLAWMWLVTLYPPAPLSALTFVTPLFGILAGIVLLGEPASAVLFAAFALVAAGLRLVSRRVPAAVPA